MLALTPVFAADRFDLQGDATLQPDAPSLRGSRFELRASLTAQPGPAIAVPALSGGPYLLNALTSTTSLVCYNDTIFRNDFDGDGF